MFRVYSLITIQIQTDVTEIFTVHMGFGNILAYSSCHYKKKISPLSSLYPNKRYCALHNLKCCYVNVLHHN